MKKAFVFILLICGYTFSQPLYMSKITAPDPLSNAWFGTDIKLQNGQLVVGSPGDKRKGTNSGSFYIYEVGNHFFKYKKKYFTWNIKEGDRLGEWISFADTNLFLRVWALKGANFNFMEDVHYYTLNDYSLKYKNIIKRPYNKTNGFGSQVHTVKNRFLFTAWGTRDSLATTLGCFNVYNASLDSNQTLDSYYGVFKGIGIPVGLGTRFAANDSLLFVSAAFESDSLFYKQGCVYVYRILPDTFIFKEKFCSPLPQSFQSFGLSLALSGNRLFVGAPQEDIQIDQGRVYIYDISEDTPKLTHTLTSPGSTNYNLFGMHISALGDSLLVGSPNDSAYGWLRGAVYLYTFDNANNIKLERSIGLPDSAGITGFPSALVLTKDFILAGAPGADSGRGAVYMYSLSPPTEVKQEPFFEGDFLLEQNYPNPFNPVTSIKYSLRTGGEISLILYDCLGVKVRTLVNEFQYPGDYEVELNAAGLASGVYLYKLQAGTFVQTKKLVLLK